MGQPTETTTTADPAGASTTAEQVQAVIDDINQRAAELREAAGGESVGKHVRDAADRIDVAVEQLEEQARLLSEAEVIEQDAADLEAQGDTLSAELYRGEAALVRARAEAIQPEIPEVDQRILGFVGGPQPVDDRQPASASVPASSAPGSPVGPGRPGAADSDGDGLGDALERQLGTNVHDADTDGDGYPDGHEVMNPFLNPRAKELEDAGPEEAATEEAAARAWEAEHGLERNTDSDGDGVADWIERFGLKQIPDLTADDIENNLAPVDDFVESAISLVGTELGSDRDADRPGDGSSVLVEFAAADAGVRDLPEGPWDQYRWLHEQGSSTSVDEALRTTGALVFGFPSDPLAAPDQAGQASVAISVGDGKNVVGVSGNSGEVRLMPAGDTYGYGATIPALHAPTGDLDGDGWTDQEEMAAGGDPSRGITSPRDDAAVDPGIPLPQDGSGEADPLGTDETYDDGVAVDGQVPDGLHGGARGGSGSYDPSAELIDPYAGGSDTGTSFVDPYAGDTDPAFIDPYADDTGPAEVYGDTGSDTAGDTYADAYSDSSTDTSTYE